MLRYVYGQDQLVADFVARAKHASGFSPYAGFADKNLRAIGIVNADDELIAGLVYYDWRPQCGTIEISIEALPKQNWLTRTTLKVMFQYPFLSCGCQALYQNLGRQRACAADARRDELSTHPHSARRRSRRGRCRGRAHIRGLGREQILSPFRTSRYR